MSLCQTNFQNVTVYRIFENGQTEPHFQHPVSIRTNYDPQGLLLSFLPDETSITKGMDALVEKGSPPVRIGRCGFLISVDTQSILFKFDNETDSTSFQIQVGKALKGSESSVFAERTEDSSALQYFQFYGYLSQQQNMMQDYIRTATYQRAIVCNQRDFQDKVVLDVGAGSGILSFFALQAGARKVYAVEASSMAMHAEALASANGMKDKLIVLAGKIEEVELPEKVDAIISEPMGYMLYNERMLETYLHAKKWLKPQGKMFPSRGDLHVAPFTDEALYLEQCNKANFWEQHHFHGVDLRSLREAALKEYFRQPIVDTFDIRICLAKSIKHTVDFQTASEYDLHEIEVPFEFTMLEAGHVHGLAFWFDVAFEGSNLTVWLSTAPAEPLTHWYQVRCLIDSPILVKKDEILRGRAVLRANKRQSYDVLIELEGGGVQVSNTLDLKNPYFRYTGQAPPPPPGHHSTAPSETMWTAVESAKHAENGLPTTLNGSLVDGMGNLVEMGGHNAMIGMGQMGQMGVIPGHQLGGNVAMTHYTAVPLLGEYVAAAGGPQQQQGLLLSNTNVNVLPASHGISWSH